MSQRSVLRSTVLVGALALALPAAAHATFPGENGLLAYSVAKYDRSAKDYGFLGAGALFTLNSSAVGAAPMALPGDPDATEFEPSWSPDGSQIAFGSLSGKLDGIYVRLASQTAPPKLVAKSVTADMPTWTPDGKTILYADWDRGIMAVPADRSADPRMLVRKPKGWALLAPSVTPDGSRFLYARQKMNGSPKSYRTELWSADVTGAGARKILGSSSAVRLPHLPDVSPDGTRIVFEGNTPKDGSALFVADSDGSNPRVLTVSPRSGAIGAPAWSPDGKLVVATVFGSSVKKGSSIVLVDVASGKLSTLRRQSKAYLSGLSWQSLPLPSAVPAG